MVGGLLAVTCRTLVGTVFILTAGWKLSHSRDFQTAFDRLAPRRFAALRPFARQSLAAFEGGLAVAVMTGSAFQPLTLPSLAVAAILVCAFTAVLVRADDATDCGCWFAPPEALTSAKYLPTVRNIVLIAVLGVTAVLAPAPVAGLTLAASLAPAVVGVIFGALLVELPHILGAVTFLRRSLAREGLS